MTRPHRSRYTATRLVRRQLAAEPVTAVLVAATVLLVSFVLSLWPRATGTLLGEDTRERLQSLTPAQRDLTGREAAWFPDPSEAEDLDGHAQIAAWLQQMELARAGAGPSLRHVMREAEVVATRPEDPVEKGPRADDILAETLAIRVDARIGERVQLVEGRAPEPWDASGLFEGRTPFDVLRARPLEVMASVDTADRMRWRVGEQRDMTGVVPIPVVLVGTFEAVDPAAGYWSHLESTLFPHIVEDGNVGTTVNGTAYADPSTLAALVLGDGVALDRWYATDVAATATTDRAQLLRELRAFLAEQELRSELTDRLADVTARQGTFASLLGVLAAGPAGVALGVLWLAAVLAAERRRGALVLAAVRGASGAGVRLAMAAQGLVVAAPAAALGALAAAAVLPRPVALLGPVVWAVPAAVAVAPALLMALAAGPAMREARRGRPDAPRRAREAREVRDPAGGRRGAGRFALSPARRRRLRVGLEVAVVGLAGFAAWATRQRGLAGGGASGRAGDAVGGADPLLVAGPVLLALAGGVLALRLYPLPLRALTRALHRRRRLPHFLGAAEATRSPRAGLAAVVALVLGVGIAVFSGVAHATVRGGVERTAAAVVGADVRVDAEGITAGEVAAVAGLDGVARVAEVAYAGRGPFALGSSEGRVDVMVVDPAALAAVQAGLPGVVPLPDLAASPAAAAETGVPAILGGRKPEHLDRPAVLRWGADFEPIALEGVATADAVPGVTSGTSWIVVDRATWLARTGGEPRVDRLLLDLAPGADARAVAARARDLLADPDGGVGSRRVTVTALGDVRAGVGDAALARGLTVGMLAGAGVAGLLAVVVLALALAVRAPDRARLVGLLATVGAPRGTTWRLVAWEVAPLVGAGVLVGLVVGAVLPWVVLPTADLRPFTGGLADPPLRIDPAVPLLVGGAAVLAAVLAVALAAAVSSRSRSAAAAVVLREGERA